MNTEEFMLEAIAEAQKALANNEGMGFGAIIVRNGEIISRGHNAVREHNNPTSHAEVNAINAACALLGSVDLKDCTLYSTCEPCPMCFTAAWWGNISRIVFGVSLEDVTNVSEEILVSSEYLNEKGGSKIIIEPGFLREECLSLYTT